MNEEVGAVVQRRDRWLTAFGMVLAAVNLSIAIHIDSGQYDVQALEALTFGLFLAIVAIALPSNKFAEGASRKGVIVVAVGGSLLNILLLNIFTNEDTRVLSGAIVVGGMAALSLLDIPYIKHIGVALMLLAYLFIGAHEIRDNPAPKIDVFQFQQDGAQDLLKGENPYAARWESLYHEPQQTLFYGPGVVDSNHMLTYGFPYPPLSLIMAVPGYLVCGDVRYAHLAAMLISAGLMAYARPGRLGILASALFLLMPRSLFVIQLAWTEPFLLLMFSLTLFCACRWRKGLPYAFGLFLATKQYSILALPVIVLLTDEIPALREMFWMLFKAGIVAAVVTAPMFLWNPHEFWHAVVEWQFVQPFRNDALSYLVWFHRNHITWPFNPATGKPWIWIPFVAILVPIALSLWRCPRTPAGFAAATTLIYMVFFALNKQAFCNYYFFVVGTACWAVAAFGIPPRTSARRGFEVLTKNPGSTPAIAV